MTSIHVTDTNLINVIGLAPIQGAAARSRELQPMVATCIKQIPHSQATLISLIRSR
jgi:hypothetical protein